MAHRRLVKDYEQIPEVLLGLHLFAFAIVLLKRLAPGVCRGVHNTL